MQLIGKQIKAKVRHNKEGTNKIDCTVQGSTTRKTGLGEKKSGT